jgi:hypothetical protein
VESKQTKIPRPGDKDWPVAWVTYDGRKSADEDFADLVAHGVHCVSWGAHDLEQARAALQQARRAGMQFHLNVAEITENARLMRNIGIPVSRAVMIGGCYRGRAIDRHVFTFAAGRHEIVIEPPVYNGGFAYTRRGFGKNPDDPAARIGHYYPDMGDPLRAEVIVPLKPFDGRAHVRVVPAQIRVADANARPENDSAAGLAPSDEVANRKLYVLSFDLSGLEDAMLDHVGLAVYWTYGGTDQYWIFGRGNAAARAESTRRALRELIRSDLDLWCQANGGPFPHDVVRAARFGDECFYITGHVFTSPAVSYPLWEYSESALAAFHQKSGGLEPPRTWGFPSIYGVEAYAWWMYLFHESCADLCGVLRDEIARKAPGLLLFRNTTRMGVFDLSNDHDGSGQELLARHLDVVHLDPYPVTGRGYTDAIPRDMSYCAGLARRYGRLLIPWMQAHTYGGSNGLQHVSADQVARMADEQWEQGVDAVIWLGYGGGNTFPDTRPDSWKRAGEFHHRLAVGLPPKPEAKLAVLRGYGPWAVASEWEDRIRNPLDWHLQQALEVWAVRYRNAYDVFEIPPGWDESAWLDLKKRLAGYTHVLSTVPWEGAWTLEVPPSQGTVDPSTADKVRNDYENEMKRRGWLP